MKTQVKNSKQTENQKKFKNMKLTEKINLLKSIIREESEDDIFTTDRHSTFITDYKRIFSHIAYRYIGLTQREIGAAIDNPRTTGTVFFYIRSCEELLPKNAIFAERYNIILQKFNLLKDGNKTD